MMFRSLAAAGLLLFSVARGTHAEEACPSEHIPAVAVAATKVRLASNHQVMIVTLGSSSTEGVRASSPSSTYPARLQGDLSLAFPLAHVAVINRGIGGQDALEEVARLDADVIALRPDMVVWQVGANGAMAHSDPEVFRKLVSTGIERMKALGIDIILMDNQRSPMIMASSQHVVLEQILSELAAKYNVSLFSRGSLMDSWKQDGFAYDHFLSTDYVHMNDLGYRCTADALAGSIEQGLGLSENSRLAAARVTQHASK